jgi:RNA polymerase sigma factor (sigma-70 family)
MARNTHRPYHGRSGEGSERSELPDERWRRMWSHREQLLKVARRRSMSVEDAEDAVHEAMLRAVENPGIDDERLAAWLTTVTMRLCVDRYRQLNREAEVSSRTALVAPAPVPVEEVVCDRAEAKWLARRSRSLPARQAEALQLKSQDLDVDQVATQMGLSYEAAESLLARARRAMRNSLASTLALAVWLGRGRPEVGAGSQAAMVAVASTVTLAALGIALPHAYDGGGPRTPGVSRVHVVDEPAGGRGKEEHTPAPRPASRPDSAPTPTPGSGNGLKGVTSLIPEVPEVPEVPDVPDVPKVPTAPEVSGVPSVPSATSDVRLPAPPKSVPKTTEPALPTDSDAPGSELPDSDELP